MLFIILNWHNIYKLQCHKNIPFYAHILQTTGHIYHGMCLGYHFWLNERQKSMSAMASTTEQGSLLSVPGTWPWILTKKSMTSSEHHVMTFWWCWGVSEMTFMSVLKGFKRKNAQEGRASKFHFHRVKIHTLKCTSVHPSTWFARNFYKKREKSCV